MFDNDLGMNRAEFAAYEAERYDVWCEGRDDDAREFGVVNGHLVEYVGRCTCVADSLAPSVTNGHHEKGCGLEDYGRVVDVLRPCQRDHTPDVEQHVPSDESPF